MRALEVFDGVRIVISDKGDGNMRPFSDDDLTEALANQEKIAKELGVKMDKLLRGHVTYDRDNFTQYAVAMDATKHVSASENKMPVADGLLIDRNDMGIILPLADCLGLVLYDAKLRRLMLVHAGRHTLEQSGASKAVNFMVKNGSNAKHIRAFLSPAAGKANYPIHKLGGMGLAEAAKDQLTSAGVAPEHIIDANIDTTIDENFYSHSSGDTRARFAIGVRMIYREVAVCPLPQTNFMR